MAMHDGVYMYVRVFAATGNEKQSTSPCTLVSIVSPPTHIPFERYQ